MAGIANLDCSKGSLTYAEFYDFYYKAVKNNFYKGCVIGCGLGKTVRCRVLEVAQKGVRVWTIFGKEEFIEFEDITKIEVCGTADTERVIRGVVHNGYGGFDACYFPTDERGYDSNALSNLMNDICNAVSRAGKAWYGEATLMGSGEVIGFRSFQPGFQGTIMLDTSPVSVESLQSIGFKEDMFHTVEGSLSGGSSDEVVINGNVLSCESNTLTGKVLYAFLDSTRERDVYASYTCEDIYKGKYSGYILSVDSDVIQMYTTGNDIKKIPLKTITKLTFIEKMNVKELSDKLAKEGSVVIERTQFYTNGVGFDVKETCTGICDTIKGFQRLSKASWVGEVYDCKGRVCATFVTLPKYKEPGQFGNKYGYILIEDVKFGEQEYKYEDIGSIKLKTESTTTKASDTGTGFTNAMNTMSMKKQEDTKMSNTGYGSFYEFMINTFTSGNMVSITMKNGKSESGYVDGYINCGEDTLLILREASSYGSKTAFDKHAIKITEIAEVSYSGKQTQEKAPSDYFIQ